MPALSSWAAVLLDGETGEVLYQWRSGVRMYPASLTKMMTGLLTAERGSLAQTITASKLAASTGESSIALKEGEQLTLEQLLEGSLIKSANDATVACAEAVGGTVPQFVDQMNQRALQIGMTGTHFCNPHGLHNPAHYSTAMDLGRLAWVAMQNPQFASIVGTRETVIPWPGKPWARKLVNRNRLLLRWDKCDGVKTGYTRQAGRCLAASATENDWRLVCVVLRCKNSWQDAQNLLQWGFSHFRHVRLVAGGRPDFRVPVRYGVRKTVVARAAGDLGVRLKPGETAPELHLSRRSAAAPVTMGAEVGKAWIEWEGQRREVRLLACEEIPRSLWGTIASLRLPEMGVAALVAVAAGVLLHGAGTKTARTRRRRLAARRRKADPSGPRHG
jgi:D-alanyl-D-alanine carboxypeptidase